MLVRFCGDKEILGKKTTDRKSRQKPPPPAVVGIDIGTNTIKVAEAKYDKEGLSITSIGIAPTPPGLIDNEVITDPAALGSAVKALLTESNIRTKKSVSSVAGQSRVVVRTIDVPKMSADDLAETMKWEVERHVPFSPSEVVMDFAEIELPHEYQSAPAASSEPDDPQYAVGEEAEPTVMGDAQDLGGIGPDEDDQQAGPGQYEEDDDQPATPDTDQMEVLLAVAQDELVNSHIETIASAGLKPMAIDVESLASGRAFLGNGVGTGIVGVLDIGAKKTELSVFVEGVLVFPSPPLGIAGDTLTNEIAETLGIPFEEAEILKKTHGSVDMEMTAAPQPFEDAESTVYDSGEEQFSTVFDTDDGGGVAAADLSDLGLGVEPPASEDVPQETDFSQAEPMPGPSFDIGGDEQQFSTEVGPSEEETAEEDSDSVQGVYAQGASGLSFDLGDEEEQEEEPASEPEVEAEAAGPEPTVTEEDTVNVGSVGGDSYGHPEQNEETAQVVRQAVTGVLIDLASDIRNSLEYYNVKYEKWPEKLIISGGTCKLPGISEFFTRELGVHVEVCDSLAGKMVDVPQLSEPALKELSPLLGVCIGLAIRDMLQ